MIGSMETSMSARALEETGRTIARLASSTKNVPQLIESGALSQIGKVLQSQGGNLDMQASMVLALDRIASANPLSLDTVFKDPAAVACMVANLTANPAHVALSKASVDLISRFTVEQCTKVDLGKTTAAVLSVLENLSDSDVTMMSSCLSTLDHLLEVGNRCSAHHSTSTRCLCPCPLSLSL